MAGKALFWGTPILQFVPWWDTAFRLMQSGNLPLWNPDLGMGAPLLANYQSALLYPPTWLYFFAATIGGGTGALAWMQAILVAAHLAWAGFGMAYLVRSLGCGLLAQVISGLSFGLCGYLVSRSGFLSINAAVAWLPWVMATLYNLIWRGFSLPRYLALSLVCGLQLLAGHAQTSWYTWLLAGLWAGFWGWHSTWKGSKWKGVLRGWGLMIAGLLFALGLAAGQLLPTAEYLQQSQRASAVDFEYAMTYSFWPWHLLTLIAPDLFGNPAHGDYWGYAYYWEDAIYIGLLPFILVIMTIVGWVMRNLPRKVKKTSGATGSDQGASAQTPVLPVDSLIPFLTLVLIISIILGLGKNTPLFPWLYQHVPTFSMFQAPARFLIWGEFSLVLLAAFGAENWRRPAGRGLYWTRLATAAAFAVMLGAGLGWILMGDIKVTFLRSTALAGLCALVVGILSLKAPDKGLEKPAGWLFGVSIFLCVDLLVANWGLNPGEDLSLYTDPAPTAQEVRQKLQNGRLYISEPAEKRLKYDRFFHMDTFATQENWHNLRATLLPNMNLLDGIASANNFDPLLPGRYAQFMQYLSTVEGDELTPWLNLMAVKVVEYESLEAPYGVVFVPVETESGSPGANQSSGRLRWVACARSVSEIESAEDHFLHENINFEQQVLLEGVESLQPSPDCQSSQAQVLQLNQEGPNRLIVWLQSPAAGWVVLSDVWYPGWRAWVDGKETQVIKANYVFRAVSVPEGKHEIVMAYQPASFFIGIGITVLTWLGLGIFSFKNRTIRTG
jgi:hypothetical protein